MFNQNIFIKTFSAKAFALPFLRRDVAAPLSLKILENTVFSLYLECQSFYFPKPSKCVIQMSSTRGYQAIKKGFTDYLIVYHRTKRKSKTCRYKRVEYHQNLYIKYPRK